MFSETLVVQSVGIRAVRDRIVGNRTGYRTWAGLPVIYKLLLMTAALLYTSRAWAQDDPSVADADDAGNNAIVQDASGSIIHLIATGSTQVAGQVVDESQSSDGPTSAVPVLTDTGSTPETDAPAPADVNDDTSFSSEDDDFNAVSESAGEIGLPLNVAAIEGHYPSRTTIYLATAAGGMVALGGAAALVALRRRA